MSPHIKTMLNWKNQRIAIAMAVVLLLITAIGAAAAVPNDTTVANFAAGSGCYVGQTLTGTDGEVVLTPTFGDMFDGAMPSDWLTHAWTGSSGTGSVGSGVLTVDDAVTYSPVYAQPRSIEFVATFATTIKQHAGFMTVDAVNETLGPWAFFSTGYNGIDPAGYELYVRTSNTADGTGETITGISGTFQGVPHRYRIEWTASTVVYSIDGTVVVTHTSPTDPVPTSAMNVGFSDAAAGNVLTVDWVRISPYATTCKYTSGGFNSGTEDSQWLTLNATGLQQPGVTAYSFETCASNTSGSCTTWNPVTGSTIYTPTFGQYVRYRASLTTTNQLVTPIINSVNLTGQSPTAVIMEAFDAQSGRPDWAIPLLVTLLVVGGVVIVAGRRLRVRPHGH